MGRDSSFGRVNVDIPLMKVRGKIERERDAGVKLRLADARQEGVMPNILTRKLELFGSLPEDDKRLLDETITRPRRVEDHQDIIREGDAPDDVHLVLDGFACRYKLLADGRRSIFAYLVPGDFCDLNIFILKAMDHGIATLSPCTVVDIPRSRVLELLEHPAIARALWWATLVDEATLREWLVNMGRRDAETSIAHLFCEIHLRLQSIGLTDDSEFKFPVTQLELSDTMGLSAVHVNRSLQSLQSRNLIVWSRGRIKIVDVDQLYSICNFNPNYLHLGGGKYVYYRNTTSRILRSFQSSTM